MTTEVEYYCEECGVNFYVYHSSEERNTHCHWCRQPVRLTGKVSKFENDNTEVVTYLDGIEIERRPARKRIIN